MCIRMAGRGSDSHFDPMREGYFHPKRKVSEAMVLLMRDLDLPVHVPSQCSGVIDVHYCFQRLPQEM